MKAVMVYFSQTGNTKKVSRAMAEAMREKGCRVEEVTLKKARSADLEKADVIGIGAPCFMSQAPTPVKEFLKSLPGLEGRAAFVFATSGGGPGRVLYDMASILEDKGARVAGGYLARGECFYPAPCIYGRFPGRPDEKDLDGARRFAHSLAGHVSSGGRTPVEENREDLLHGGHGLYDFAATISTDALNRLLLPAPMLDVSRCDQCRRCAAECPTANISMGPYPVLGPRCIRCHRCLTVCPQNAFHANWLFGNAAVWSFYNRHFEKWFGDVKPGERLY